MSVPVPKTATGADFSHMHAMLKQKAEHSKLALDAYSNGPLTLSILARLLGRSVVEIPSGWPTEGPQLFVCAGTHDERNTAVQLLQRREAVYVVDAVTIAELVHLGCGQALAALPKVLVSTKTLELLEAQVEEAKTERSGGQVFDDDGAMRFVEFTEEIKKRRLAHFQAMVDATHRYCEVVPTYGPKTLPHAFETAERVLEDEEYSALLLAVEHGATLLTLDGRLAQLATETLELKRVWPQVVIRYAEDLGHVNHSSCLFASVKQFLGDRNFVSLGAEELMFMVLQGGWVLRTGVQKFKRCLASPATDFPSATAVMFDFLKLQAVHPTQFKAFVELLCHLCEASLQNPACQKDEFLRRVADFAIDLVLAANIQERNYPPLEKQMRLRHKIQAKALQEALIYSVELSKEPMRRRAVKLSTLKCTQVPMLTFDGDVPEPDEYVELPKVLLPIASSSHDVSPETSAILA